MRLRIPSDNDSVLLPDFGSRTDRHYRVCLLPRIPSEGEINDLCKRDSDNYGVVIFVTAAMDANQRQQLAAASTEQNGRVLVIDEAILLYALSEEAFRPLTLFELAQPSSFAAPCNDFGNAAVPREMFFGRRGPRPQRHRNSDAARVAFLQQIRRIDLLQRLPAAESDRDRERNQAATWNSSAMKLAWARMSRLPTPRTCPFLIIAIVS